MTIAPRAFLALAAVVEIALHGREQPLPAKQLAERLALPPRQLDPMLQALVRRKILKSVRGPHGGYALAQERRRLKAGDVLRAVLDDEPEDDTASALVGPEREAATAAFLASLDTQTLEAICRRVSAGARQAQTDGDAHFTI